MTPRDRAYVAALSAARDGEPVKSTDIADRADCSPDTASGALHALEEVGVVERETNRSHIYYPAGDLPTPDEETVDPADVLPETVGPFALDENAGRTVYEDEESGWSLVYHPSTIHVHPPDERGWYYLRRDLQLIGRREDCPLYERDWSQVALHSERRSPREMSDHENLEFYKHGVDFLERFVDADLDPARFKKPIEKRGL